LYCEKPKRNLFPIIKLTIRGVSKYQSSITTIEKNDKMRE